MKKLLFLILLMTASWSIQAQLYANGQKVPLKTYLSVTLVKTTDFGKVNFEGFVDAGQKDKNARLSNSNGRKLFFYGLVDLLNCMDEEGYDYLETIPANAATRTNTSGNKNSAVYLFKRR